MADFFYKKERVEKLFLKKFQNADSVFFDYQKDRIYVFKKVDYKNKTDTKLKVLFDCDMVSIAVDKQLWIQLKIDILNADDLKLDLTNIKDDDFENDS